MEVNIPANLHFVKQEGTLSLLTSIVASLLASNVNKDQTQILVSTDEGYNLM